VFNHKEEIWKGKLKVVPKFNNNGWMCEFAFMVDITIHWNGLGSFVHFCVFFKTDAISILFTVSLDVPHNVTWIKINCHQKGYYRVNYNKENWDKLIELLKNDFTVRTVT